MWGGLEPVGRLGDPGTGSDCLMGDSKGDGNVCGLWDVNPGSLMYQLCDLGQIT